VRVADSQVLRMTKLAAGGAGEGRVLRSATPLDACSFANVATRGRRIQEWLTIIE
jgi:hypothetical protein